MKYNTSNKTKMCLAEFKGFAQLCLCRRVPSVTLFFPRLVTAFSPRALLGFGVFKLRRVLVSEVPSDNKDNGDNSDNGDNGEKRDNSENGDNGDNRSKR